MKDFHTIELITYEKNIIGYLKYMGSKMYFDRDGVIVESSNRVLSGIPKVEGIRFKKVILHKAIETEQKSVFQAILTLVQICSKYQMDVKTISYDDKNSFSIELEKITVVLGEDELLESKVSELQDILPELEGEEGTLYLDNYGVTGKGYKFARKQVESE
ncbi:Cell division protein FtsQ [Lachnospiraceae bacterium TWA4]|nr:Cell division protein FtsQ [Lachnospiraceae bacterium TWA4]